MIYSKTLICLLILISLSSCETELQEQTKCIDELVHFIPNVIEIIELITKADWIKDIGKIVELTMKGIPLIHKCISTFDEENENRKTFIRVLQEKKSHEERLQECAKFCVKFSPSYQLTCMSICVGNYKFKK